jgi:hypothetical protein
VALVTLFFCFLFFHLHELLMIVIMGQGSCGFRGRNIEECENGPANHEKENVINDVFLFGVHYLVGNSLAKQVG